MKSIFSLLKNIRNLVPYFILIAIYFFFVNLEASKDRNINLNSETDNLLPDVKPSLEDKNIRIKIPVVPYN